MAFAPPGQWETAWPRPPVPTGVELVHLDSEGLPALDRPEPENGLSKRSYGIRQGAVCLLGDPRPDSAVGLILVEGTGRRPRACGSLPRDGGVRRWCQRAAARPAGKQRAAWVTLHIQTGDNELTKRIFEQLQAERDDIEARIDNGSNHEWHWLRHKGPLSPA